MNEKKRVLIIDIVLFIYILAIYLFDSITGMTKVANFICAILIGLIWVDFLLCKRKLVINKVLISFIGFVLISVASSLWAINSDIAMNKSKTMILLLILMLSLINYIDSLNKIEKILKYFIYSGIILSFLVLKNVNITEITRFGSEFGNVNVVGLNLATSAILSIYFILSKNKVRYYLYTVFLIGILILTGSRKAILLVIISSIIMMILKGKKNFYQLTKYILICCLMVFLITYSIFEIPILYQIAGKRVQASIDYFNGTGTKEQSMNERMDMIKFGKERINDKPFKGYGLDNYRLLYAKGGGRDTYSHNNYIELLIGVGILGTTMYYITHVVALHRVLVFCKRGNRAYMLLGYAFISVIISYLIIGYSLVYYDSKSFVILLAVSSCISKCNNKKIKCFDNYVKILDSI